MGGITVAKLSARDRRELPNEVFGLPKDRKYPLIDEAHVRKAIQYFKFCPPGQRNELSKNINAQAKKLGMQLSISKDSLFYKYADKNIVKESTYMDFQFQRLVEIGSDEILNITNLIQGEFRVAINRVMNKLFITPTIIHLLEIEKEIQRMLLDYKTFQKIYNAAGQEHLINPVTHVNNAMKQAYDMLFGFLKYNFPTIDFSTHCLITNVFEDLFFYLKEIPMSQNPDSVNKFKEKLKLIDDMTLSLQCNNYYVVRKLLEVTTELKIELCAVSKLSEPDNNYKNALEMMHQAILQFTPIIIKRCHNDYDPTIINKQTEVFSLVGSNMNFVNSIDYLKVLKNELKSQIDIILLERDMNSGDDSFNNSRFFTNIIDREDREILSIIGYLEGSLRRGNIPLYNKNYCICVQSSELLAFSELNKFERLYVGKDRNREDVFYGLCKDKLYLLGKTKTSGELIMIKLYECGKEMLKISNLICDPERFDKSDKMAATKITIGRICDTRCVTEGISFDEDGGIKFSFKPKKSYMDEYSENHKVLIQNFKAKNYDGMKTNLAFLFDLLNKIERRLYGSKGIDPEVKKDMEKARMFAINDFKTYLKEVVKAEPGFDFTTYYESSDYGKITVGFKKKDIVGMKRLFQTIILS